MTTSPRTTSTDAAQEPALDPLVASVESRLTPEEVALWRCARGKPLSELARIVADLLATKARVSGDSLDLERAVSAMHKTAQIRRLELRVARRAKRAENAK